MFDGINDSLLYARELTKLLLDWIAELTDCFHVIPMSKLNQ